MRILILGATLALLTACSGSAYHPEMFVKPDDCFNSAKESHPDYIDSCGNTP